MVPSAGAAKSIVSADLARLDRALRAAGLDDDAREELEPLLREGFVLDAKPTPDARLPAGMSKRDRLR